jgi:hypothetical protein
MILFHTLLVVNLYTYAITRILCPPLEIYISIQSRRKLITYQQLTVTYWFYLLISDDYRGEFLNNYYLECYDTLLNKSHVNIDMHI